ncbi:uncharacterized protein RCC_06375 [Ramularia collo-cygni]|uniref:EF-hand domain-containing protein n=1 Tax=Ramularia collo-cygni TaxID=112498 RepID=A0A2D3V1B2_9PEZI|nr:uncharacterized protein RCC_06375 [Ramularia collo-cygni]CZT20515.1 uncharacterized protein RCC_06375 [Ramularia collo-cygni]
MLTPTALMLAIACATSVQAACCHARSSDGGCGDGTFGTPFCGFRSCNIFGCGGCRPGLNRAQDPFEESAPDTCRYDSTFDFVADPAIGSVSLADYLAWAVKYQHAATYNGSALQHWTNVFNTYDANGDGMIDFDEMHRQAPEKKRLFYQQGLKK